MSTEASEPLVSRHAAAAFWVHLEKLDPALDHSCVRPREAGAPDDEPAAADDRSGADVRR